MPDDWTLKQFSWIVEIVKRLDEGFVILKRRWIVERTFGWLARYRRLSKDYEVLPQTSETVIRISMINLMLHRLCPERKIKHEGF